MFIIIIFIHSPITTKIFLSMTVIKLNWCAIFSGRYLDLENPYVLPVESCVLDEPISVDSQSAIVDWASYYKCRELDLSSPVAILLQWPLTVFFIIQNVLNGKKFGRVIFLSRLQNIIFFFNKKPHFFPFWSPESLKWPIAMAWRPTSSCVVCHLDVICRPSSVFFSRTTGTILTKFSM